MKVGPLVAWSCVVMTDNRRLRWYFLYVVISIRRLSKSKRSPGRSIVLWTLLVLAVLLYWWWPGLVGAGDPSSRPAVVIIGDGEMLQAKTVVSRRLVEEGLTVAVIEVEDSWCGVSKLLETSSLKAGLGVVIALDPSVVTSCIETGGESDLTTLSKEVLRSLRLLTNGRMIVMSGLVPGSDQMPGLLQNVGLIEVDVSGILAGTDERVDCFWWDDCVPDENGIGYVVLRDDQGLTQAGQQRLARRIVAEVQP